MPNSSPNSTSTLTLFNPKSPLTQSLRGRILKAKLKAIELWKKWRKESERRGKTQRKRDVRETIYRSYKITNFFFVFFFFWEDTELLTYYIDL